MEEALRLMRKYTSINARLIVHHGDSNFGILESPGSMSRRDALEDLQHLSEYFCKSHRTWK